ncbi:hypothetical protein HanHA300_Chr09g0333281 [Helianthus annuus]|nr:hypothetical protein HanHA300_Chr09g0333281 [Helianthus annuus]KAJ0543773.1 hypothetical protein HanHA89_Chr09g0354261 [Helianthus annuus]KAJ0708826.1 hypothetical protein HanLR1_Chr09g0333561 [Helianthus annuus]KAJ0894685.1 hypothetical protein HanPSC8_Chr09g0391791 [Helianthus annuus]
MDAVVKLQKLFSRCISRASGSTQRLLDGGRRWRRSWWLLVVVLVLNYDLSGI